MATATITTITTNPTRPTTPATRPRRDTTRLRPPLRKAALVVHLLSAGAWIGIDVVAAVLVGYGWLGADPSLRGLAYEALGRFVLAPMLTAGLLCVASGLVLGLGTKWGLVRYWWVAVKLAVAVALCALVVLALRPQLAEVAAYGAALRAGEPPAGDISDIAFPPVVSLSALTFATVLSVFKPWGRVRAGRTAARTGAAVSPGRQGKGLGATRRRGSPVRGLSGQETGRSTILPRVWRSARRV